MKLIKILIASLGLIFAGSALATNDCSVTVNLAGTVYNVPALDSSGTYPIPDARYGMTITAWDPASLENVFLTYIPNTKNAFTTTTLACQTTDCAASTVTDPKNSKKKLLKLVFSNQPCTLSRVVFSYRYVSNDGKQVPASGTSSDGTFGPNKEPVVGVVMNDNAWAYTSKTLAFSSKSAVVPGALGRGSCSNDSPYYCRSGLKKAEQGYCYWRSGSFNQNLIIPGVMPAKLDASCDD